MAKVEVTKTLENEINKVFKGESVKVFQHIKSLETTPCKGKELGTVGGIVIKEIKYKNYRFYFIVDGHKLKFFDEKELVDLFILFVRMSDKKQQQKTIDKIKHILRTVGEKGFN